MFWYFALESGDVKERKVRAPNESPLARSGDWILREEDLSLSFRPEDFGGLVDRGNSVVNIVFGREFAI